MFGNIVAYLKRKIKRQRKMKLDDILNHNLQQGQLTVGWEADIPFDGGLYGTPKVLTEADTYGLEGVR